MMYTFAMEWPQRGFYRKQKGKFCELIPDDEGGGASYWPVAITYAVLLGSDQDSFTVEEVAAAFMVKDDTVRKMLQSGELSALKFGGSWRIKRSTLEKLVSEEYVPESAATTEPQD